MSAFLRDIMLVWRYGAKPRDRLFTAIAAGLFALAGLAIVTYVWIDGGPAAIIRFASAGALAGVLLVGWTALANGTVALNTPYAAWFVPSSRDRLVRVALTTGAAICIVCTLAFGLCHGDMARGALYGIGIACAMGGIVVSRSGRKFAGLCLIEAPIIGNAVFLSKSARAFMATFSTWEIGAVLVLLLVAAIRWSVRTSYPRGNSASAAVVSKAARQSGTPYEPRYTLWLTQGLYRAVMRFDLRGATPGAGMLHVLGPTAHWSISLGYAACVVLACAALKYVGLAIGAEAFVSGFGSSLLGLLAGTFLFQQRRYAIRFAATRTEQALVRLTPAAPATDRFNRAVGNALLANALLDWLFLGTAAMLLLWLFPVSLKYIAWQNEAAIWLALLPLTTLGLHDYGSHGPASAGRQTALGAGIAAALAIPTALLVHYADVRFWMALAGCSVVLALALVFLRYQRMAAAPVAFPAAAA